MRSLSKNVKKTLRRGQKKNDLLWLKVLREIHNNRMRNMRLVDNLPHVGESNNDKIKVDERVVLNTKDRVIFFLCL